MEACDGVFRFAGGRPRSVLATHFRVSQEKLNPAVARTASPSRAKDFNLLRCRVILFTSAATFPPGYKRLPGCDVFLFCTATAFVEMRIQLS
jgi:hypothetical protein